ncbi:MAG: hypothetical protein U5K71_11055 [Gracilimonas sp.]|nr:hypothetical protein [Gracilimonas sp.]
MPKKNINITVELDDKNVANNIAFKADDMPNVDAVDCRAMLLSFWDAQT